MMRARIRKRYPAGAESSAFDLDVDFEISDGVTVLFGASGSGKTLTLDSFIKGMESIKHYHDIFNGPEINFGPNIRQGANSSFLAEVKGGDWTRVTEPLGF